MPHDHRQSIDMAAPSALRTLCAALLGALCGGLFFGFSGLYAFELSDWGAALGLLLLTAAGGMVQGFLPALILAVTMSFAIRRFGYRPRQSALWLLLGGLLGAGLALAHRAPLPLGLLYAGAGMVGAIAVAYTLRRRQAAPNA